MDSILPDHEIQPETDPLLQVSTEEYTAGDVPALSDDVSKKSPQQNFDGTKNYRKTKRPKFQMHRRTFNRGRGMGEKGKDVTSRLHSQSSSPSTHLNRFDDSPAVLIDRPRGSRPYRQIHRQEDHSQSSSSRLYSRSRSPNSSDVFRDIMTLGQINEAVLAGEEHKHEISKLQKPRGIVMQDIEVAHIAARLGLQPILQLVLNQFPSLFFQRNGRGDTPLHVAARVGHINIVKYLLDPNSRDIERADEEVEKLLIIPNNKGNTALHEALENNHEEIARFLVTGHGELLYLVNKEDKTPAYLAAEAGHLQLLKYMSGLVGDSQDLSKWKGKTPLHAAIITRHPGSLKLVLELKPQLIEVTDTKGRNPLHYAASIGYYDGVIELLKESTQSAYQPDNDGIYPIHMAASKGHIKVIQLLLKSCPRSWSLLSRGGQNILHVAALSDKENVVRYILKAPEIAVLINDVDGNGSTPLHLASKSRNFKVVRILTRDRRVNMSISNDNNLTALDIAEKNIVNVASFRKLLTLTALRIANAPRARKLDIFDDEHFLYNIGGRRPRRRQRRVDNDDKRPRVESYKDRVNTLLLVSTLVATVTFAAGFTVPGGLNSNGDTDQGIAIMLNNTMFKAFVVCDAIALFCSILAVISLIWAQVVDVPLMRSIIGFTWALLGISLSMMAVAFTAAVYIVTSPLHWLATTILVMTIVFLICTLALLLPLRMPIWSNYYFFQSISYHLIYLLVAVAGSGNEGDNNGEIVTHRNFITADDLEITRFAD